jgi:hypothetical protein
MNGASRQANLADLWDQPVFDDREVYVREWSRGMQRDDRQRHRNGLARHTHSAPSRRHDGIAEAAAVEEHRTAILVKVFVSLGRR